MDTADEAKNILVPYANLYSLIGSRKALLDLFILVPSIFMTMRKKVIAIITNYLEHTPAVRLTMQKGQLC